MTRVRSWYRTARRHLGLDQQPPRDRCESCGVPIPAKKVHEVTALFDFADEPGAAMFGGGSSVTATYCPGCCEGNCGRDHNVKKKPETTDRDIDKPRRPKRRAQTRPKRSEQRAKEMTR